MKKEQKYRVWDNVNYMSSPFTFKDLQENKIQFTDDCEVMQFTGLKDKNGKEIYGGDLLSDPYPIDEGDLSKGYHESLLPVIWCNEKLRWSVDTSFAKDGTHLTSLVDYFGDQLEVKGNVFEKGEKR